MSPSKDIHVLISRTGEYVTLHGKSNSADFIELRIPRWEDYPELGWAQYHHKSSYKGEAGGSGSEKVE